MTDDELTYIPRDEYFIGLLGGMYVVRHASGEIGNVVFSRKGIERWIGQHSPDAGMVAIRLRDLIR